MILKNRIKKIIDAIKDTDISEIEIDEALIKAKAQMEYLDDREIDLMKLGFDEDDAISGDMMNDE